MKLPLTIFALLILQSGLFAQNDMMKHDMPRYRVRLVTKEGNMLKGLLLTVNDSSVVIYPGKRKEWKSKMHYRPVEFEFSNTKEVKVKKKHSGWKTMIPGSDLTNNTADGHGEANTSIQHDRRLNFVVSPRQKKFDPAPASFQLQAKLMRFFHKHELYVIIARSSEDATNKILSILEKKNAMIGNLWFDSHGHWQRRRSLFEIGNEEFNYQSIRDEGITVHLQKLAPYCDTITQVGIGSCYGGASFTLAAIENFPEQPMHGDSLMIGVSKLFNNATVYACESFVLTGPGIMNAGYALCGSPWRKKFRDSIYAPVWQRLGEWNCYSGKTGEFQPRVSVSLDPDGSIYVKPKNYLTLHRNKRKYPKKLTALKRGNYNLAYLYQHG